MTDDFCSNLPIVIVGAGAAGCAAAEELRRQGYAGRLSVIGAERIGPYDRPPLSKKILAGEWSPDRINLLSPARLNRVAASWSHGLRAVGLDAERQVVVTDDGQDHPFRAALVATGVVPRTLHGCDLDGVHTLRTLDDAIRLRSELRAGSELVIIGGGFLGLEVAATARMRGCGVTLVEPLEQPLANRLGEPLARRIVSLHEAHGVRILSGRSPTLFTRRISDSGDSPDRVDTVELSDGTMLRASVVLVAIGCTPDASWLANSALQLDDGVLCDDHCRAGHAVWAAGDVARWFNRGYGRHTRVEHRMNASEQGRAAARAILGERVPFAPLPFFWTDHFDVKVQLWGDVREDSGFAIVERDRAAGSFVALATGPDSPDVTGVIAWNAAKAAAPYRMGLQARWASLVARASLATADAATRT